MPAHTATAYIFLFLIRPNGGKHRYCRCCRHFHVCATMGRAYVSPGHAWSRITLLLTCLHPSAPLCTHTPLVATLANSNASKCRQPQLLHMLPAFGSYGPQWGGICRHGKHGPAHVGPKCWQTPLLPMFQIPAQSADNTHLLPACSNVRSIAAHPAWPKLRFIASL